MEEANREMKNNVFISFAQKAADKLQKKKKQRREQIYIPDLDETITITALTDQEFIEINEFSNDSNKNDSYMIYMSSPELQALAKELVGQKTIKEHVEVVSILKRADKRKIANQILEISGILEESDIKILSEVEETKNS